jgi:predicted phage terminase large subunit-like protein
MQIYAPLGARATKHDLTFTFPSGARVRLAHMQYETDVVSWKGSEIPLIEIDELTEFSEYQCFYLLSRNRSLCGVAPYMRFFTNPDSESWVKALLAPWVDEEFVHDKNVPEHLRVRAESGEIRWFIRENDTTRWCDADEPNAISITFIAATVYDNKLLLERDPGYLAALDALPELEKRRLKYGDWSARPSGKKFRREWFAKLFDVEPPDIERKVRFWDLAASEEPKNKKRSNPDYTASVLIGRRKAGIFPRYIILDATWDRKSPGDVQAMVKAIAEQDGKSVAVRIEEEGGSGGKFTIQTFVTQVLDGYDVSGVRSTGSKELRANLFSAQAQVGNVGMLRAHWNRGYLNFLVAFPDPRIHDDPVDASSGAFTELHLMPDGPVMWSADTPTTQEKEQAAAKEQEFRAQHAVVEIERPISPDEGEWFDMEF